LLPCFKQPNVPAANNLTEREIRPAAIMRKAIQNNRSDKGALEQAILMSIFRTLKRRNFNPVETLSSSLQDSLLSGKLAPFSSLG